MAITRMVIIVITTVPMTIVRQYFHVATKDRNIYSVVIIMLTLSFLSIDNFSTSDKA